MDEYLALPVFMKALYAQSVQDFILYICVNQPDEWWDIPEKEPICISNAESLEWLESLHDDRIIIIDKCSPGNGWEGKHRGIGWARKVLMDRISEDSEKDDIILSLDADTVFGPEYLESIRANLGLNPNAVALSVPYYHQLCGTDIIDRAMLRYEIYMRCYAINLWRIESPYCFTALGSAIALPVKSYRAIGGLTPKHSGEDFYFLQKLVKYGTVIHWNSEMVYPAGRLSDRVNFGTGPALIKGIQGDWKSYPVYPTELFAEIRETMSLYPLLFVEDMPTPLDEFLINRMGELPWTALRQNSRSREQFMRACYEKIDGLRILQFLKEKNMNNPVSDEESTIKLLETIVMDKPELKPKQFSYADSTIDELNQVRDLLAGEELNCRLAHWNRSTGLISFLN
ncbi:MAG: glycosyltransferase family 2 protein [Bacteroidales bacterium]|nr:glycosyltransferase family 2 protein [Bacteroidales bacterium]